MKIYYREYNGNQIPFKIVADENNKLTKDRTFFSNEIYLSINDNPKNYEEVGYDIWKYFIEEEAPKNKVEELQKQISNLQSDRDNLEMVLLDTNFRLTCMELKNDGLMD